ncbi:hypothetical protein BGZ63DRAFT_435578 [Mariannaea sp. PMI_226]|nr:hypothetical protein BGZ63DRAFT_435578 [Mariannaea sp. PMI_226]
MASDIMALLDHLKFDKAIFAGGNIGGIIVQKLAWYHPERVAGLIIFNTLIIGTIIHLIHHNKEQQEISKFSLEFINHNPSDP